MTLITCPDCGTEVSDAAVACPKCARPIASTPPAAFVVAPLPIPIGIDGKQGAGCVANGLRIVGVCLALLGVYVLLSGAKNEKDAATFGMFFAIDAFVLIFPGIAMIAVGEFLARKSRQ